MNQSVINIEKQQLQKKETLKCRLLTELALSLSELIHDEELGPWIEIVDNKEYILKKVENAANFGTLILTFTSKDENTLRVPLQIQKSK